MPPVLCHIAVGSNIEPEKNIPAGLWRLAERVCLTRASTFYRTAPLERPEQDDFLNGVVEAAHEGGPEALRELLREVEAETGRVRTADRHAARTLDLDVLLYGGECAVLREMTVPDPDLWRRPFLAAAVLELAPELVVPGTGKRLRDLADAGAMEKLTAAAEFTAALKEQMGL